MSNSHNRRSAFTKLLQRLGAYSEKVDDGSLTDNDFVDFQALESRIIGEYQSRHFHRNEYLILTGAYYYLKTKARILLRLDQGEEHE